MRTILISSRYCLHFLIFIRCRKLHALARSIAVGCQLVLVPLLMDRYEDFVLHTLCE